MHLFNEHLFYVNHSSEYYRNSKERKRVSSWPQGVHDHARLGGSRKVHKWLGVSLMVQW